MKKLSVKINTLGLAGAMLLFLFVSTLGAFAQVDLNYSNVVEGASNAFNYSGTIGISILTFLVCLSAVLMGWKVARGIVTGKVIS